MPRKTRTAVTVTGASALPLTFREKMVAGAIARGVAQTVLHPVDVVRTRLQARDVARNWAPGVFLKGVLPQISLAIPAGAIQFVAIEAAKERLVALFPDERWATPRLLVAGAIGALAAASFRVPQEVIKQRIQADIYPNFAVAVRETLKADGPLGLYKGALATISRDVPWNALSLMFHGQGKRIFASIKGYVPENEENLMVAGIAGAVAAVIMTPVDVVKTRLMTQRVGSAVQYSGIVNTLRKIVAEEGAGTLMKGVLPRIVFLAPLAGITFSLYEAVAAGIRKRKFEDGLRVESGSAPASYLDTAFGAGLGLRRIARSSALRFSAKPVLLASSADSEFATMASFAYSTPIFFSTPLSL